MSYVCPCNVNMSEAVFCQRYLGRAVAIIGSNGVKFLFVHMLNHFANLLTHQTAAVALKRHH